MLIRGRGRGPSLSLPICCVCNRLYDGYFAVLFPSASITVIHTMGVTRSSLTLLSTEAKAKSRNGFCCGKLCYVPGSYAYMIDLEALWGRCCHYCLPTLEERGGGGQVQAPSSAASKGELGLSSLFPLHSLPL